MDDNETEDAPPAEAEARDGFLKRLEQRHGLSAMVALATFAALFVGVLAAVPDWRDMLTGDDPAADVAGPGTATAAPPVSTPSSNGPALSAIDLVARDPRRVGEPSDNDMHFTPPAVEITVHNRGDRRSVITRAVVTVEDSAVIKQCDSQGEPLAVSATYNLTLPLQPAVGTVVRVPVSQQQRSDEADRFALEIGTPPRDVPTTVHVYRLRFELEADGSDTRLPVGVAVVAVPLAPSSAGAYFWGEMLDSGQISLDSWPGLEDAKACLKGNSATLQRLLADGAELSPKLAEAKADLRL
jgi:hypothetical protein